MRRDLASTWLQWVCSAQRGNKQERQGMAAAGRNKRVNSWVTLKGPGEELPPLPCSTVLDALRTGFGEIDYKESGCVPAVCSGHPSSAAQRRRAGLHGSEGYQAVGGTSSIFPPGSSAWPLLCLPQQWHAQHSHRPLLLFP